jgi:hypothetical protein
LWWHQQQNHQVEHSEAAKSASAATNPLALILYDPNPPFQTKVRSQETIASSATSQNNDDPLDLIKTGDIEALKRAILVSIRIHRCIGWQASIVLPIIHIRSSRVGTIHRHCWTIEGPLLSCGRREADMLRLFVFLLRIVAVTQLSLSEGNDRFLVGQHCIGQLEMGTLMW